MAAGVYNFNIEAGATLRKTFTFKDANNTAIDFTGYSFRSQLRRSPSSDVYYDITVLLEDANGNTVLPSAGIITIYMPATLTKTIACGDTIKDSDSKYCWSLEKYINDIAGDDAFVERILEGSKVLVSAEVTKETAPYV